MRRCAALVIVAASLVVLALCSTPALTADSGTVTVSVIARADAAPCLTVAPGSVGFGTLPFSTSNAALSEGTQDITVSNCGTADQNLLGSTTDATGPGGSWTPRAYNGSINPCAARDEFYLYIFGFTNPALYMTGTAAPVLASSGGAPAAFPTGDKVFRLGLIMPCQGSSGAGETKAITATFTGVVA